MKIVLDPEWRGRDLDTLRVRCPYCGAPKGVKCTIDVPGHSEGYTWVPGHSRTAKVPHNDRRFALTQAQQRARRRRQPPPPAGLHAYNQYAKLEYDQMRDWLRENWQLFLLRRIGD